MALVRRPLAADALIPRFLAPEDLAQATIALDNIDAPAGDYTATITVQGPISIEGESVVKATLKPGERAALPIQLRAAADAGDAKLTLAVAGPDGFKLTRDSELSVRPAAASSRARAWTLSSPSRSSATRSARQPIAGFSS